MRQRPHDPCCSRPAGARRARGILGAFVSTARRDLLHQRPRRRLDRRRALRLRRQLRRALVRPHQLRRGRRVDVPACSRVPVEEKPATMPDALRASSGITTVGNVPSLLLAALVGGVFALVVGVAADAALRPRGRHRDVRGARDHEQHPPLLRRRSGPG